METSRQKTENLWAKIIQKRQTIFEVLAIIFVILICFRDIIAFYTTEYTKIISDIAILILFIATIIKNRKHLHISKSDTMVCTLLFVGTLISLLNQVNLASIIYQLRSISIIYILYFSLKNLDIKIKYKKIIYTFCAIAIILTLFSIIEVISQKSLFFPEAWKNNIIYSTNLRRAYSLLNNPNTYAAFVTLIYIMIDLQPHKTRFDKILTAVMLIITMLAIGLSASRSGAIIFIIYLVYKTVTFFKHKENKFKKPIIGLTAAIFIIMSFFVVKNVVSGTIDGSDEKQNLPFVNRIIVDLISGRALSVNATDGRIYKMSKALELFKDKPLAGFGLGTFGSSGSMRSELSHYQRYNLSKDFYSDNEYIVLLVETGVLGSVIFLFFTFYFIKDNRTSRGLTPVITTLFILGFFYNIIEVLPLMLPSLIIIFSTDASTSSNDSKKLLHR